VVGWGPAELLLLLLLEPASTEKLMQLPPTLQVTYRSSKGSRH
jgi:hypothetical protein